MYLYLLFRLPHWDLPSPRSPQGSKDPDFLILSIMPQAVKVKQLEQAVDGECLPSYSILLFVFHFSDSDPQP